MSTQLRSVAALFLVALLVPQSPAGAVVADDCIVKGCARYEKADPAAFAKCKDECALEADFQVATQGLDECNKACEGKGGSPAGVGVCMEACTAKVDTVVGVIVSRACYRDCARDGKDPAGVKACEVQCDAFDEKGAASVKKAAAARVDGCFKRCAAEGGGTDVARVNACKESCPLAKLAKELMLKEKATAPASA